MHSYSCCHSYSCASEPRASSALRGGSFVVASMARPFGSEVAASEDMRFASAALAVAAGGQSALGLIRVQATSETDGRKILVGCNESVPALLLSWGHTLAMDALSMVPMPNPGGFSVLKDLTDTEEIMRMVDADTAPRFRPHVENHPGAALVVLNGRYARALTNVGGATHVLGLSGNKATRRQVAYLTLAHHLYGIFLSRSDPPTDELQPWRIKLLEITGWDQADPAAGGAADIAVTEPILQLEDRAHFGGGGSRQPPVAPPQFPGHMNDDEDATPQ